MNKDPDEFLSIICNIFYLMMPEKLQEIVRTRQQLINNLKLLYKDLEYTDEGLDQWLELLEGWGLIKTRVVENQKEIIISPGPFKIITRLAREKEYQATLAELEGK